MSLYDLLNKAKPSQGASINLNNSQVGNSLQSHFAQNVVKPYSKGKTLQAPLLLKPRAEPSEQPVESRMVHRFDTNRKEVPDSTNHQTKRPRQESHQTKLQEEHQPLKGKSSQLFKPFLRITDIQPAESIRSLQTLQRAFKHLKLSAKGNQLDYPELIEQLRSLRQDLHVQEIESRFTVQVLQFTLEFALRNDDLPNFSKCVGQLQQVCRNAGTIIKPMYLSLHIIYLLMNDLIRQYQYLVESLSIDQLANPIVRKAINLYGLLCICNFERIYRDFSQGLEGELMQHFHGRMLEQANKILAKVVNENTPMGLSGSSAKNLYGKYVRSLDRRKPKI